ncbi:MAG: hypothetical protein JKY42_03535, partial [Flavobacteriales bacterium]|nr:hypothetical protein [Flavobacteriales bacterium]
VAGINQEASSEEATVQVRSSNYEGREVGDLIQLGDHVAYSSGAIEYLIDGELQSIVSFDNDRVDLYENGEKVGERALDRESRRCGDSDHNRDCDKTGHYGKHSS